MEAPKPSTYVTGLNDVHTIVICEPEKDNAFSTTIQSARLFHLILKNPHEIAPQRAQCKFRFVCRIFHALCNQLDNPTRFCNLFFRQLTHPSCTDEERNVGEATLAEELGIAKGKQVEDRDGVFLLAGHVGITGLEGNEGPELQKRRLVNSRFARKTCQTSHIPVSIARCLLVRVSPTLKEVILRDRGRIRTLSRLIVGFQKWFCCLWKYLMPTLPK